MPADPVLAVVTDALEPFNTGGKEARYAALLPRLHGHGITVDIYTMHWWDGPKVRLLGAVKLHAISPGLPLYHGARRSIKQAAIFAACSVRLVTRTFDVLEADSIPFLHLFPLKAVTLLRRKRLLVTWHEVWGRDYWRSYLGPLGFVAAALERLAASLPDHIVAASAGTAERLGELGVREDRITVVANGIDPAEIESAVPTADVGDILCVGRLLRHKNVHLLVDAVAELRRRGRIVTLTVIGTGPEGERLAEQVSALGLTGQVEIRSPYEKRNDVLAAMKGARVFAFPTVREGFGMAALEALACGTPVVTSDHPDNQARHLVTHGVNGFLSSPDAVSLADALEIALDSPELGTAAAATGLDHSWDSMAAMLAKAVLA